MGVQALASILERLADSDTAAMEAGDAAAVRSAADAAATVDCSEVYVDSYLRR